MATTLNVILEGRSRDRGMRRYLRQVAGLANDLAVNIDRAATAGRRLGNTQFEAPRRSRGGGGFGPSTSPAEAARRSLAPRAERSTRKADRAFEAAFRESRAQAKALERQTRAQERATKAQERAAKEAERQAKLTQNLTKEQLLGVELVREQNRRRVAAARASAREILDLADGTTPQPKRGRRGGSAGGALAMSSNLSIASSEFEQFGARVEGGIRTAFNAFKDYEKGIAEITTVTDAIPVEKIKAITTDAALQFGGMPKDQVAAFYAIIQAGATDATEAQQQLVFANKLAIGGQASAEASIKAISKGVANFKSQGAEAADVADSLFVAAQRGDAKIEELAVALPNVAASASAVGLSLDETNGALALLSLRLPNAKEASTSLKAAMGSLQKPIKAAREEADRLGIDFSVAGLQAAGGLEEFLLKIRAAEGFDENTIAKLFDSREARDAINNLIDGMDTYRSIMADMANKEGAADKAFAKMANTTAQKTAKLEAQWELLKIQAGEALVPALTDLAKELGPVIANTSRWMKDNPGLVRELGFLAIKLAVAAKAVGMLTSAWSMGAALLGAGRSALGGMGRDVDSVGAKAGQATKKLGRMDQAARGLNSGMLLAAAGITAYQVAMDAASESTQKYYDYLDKRNNQNIEFQNKDGTDKSEGQLLAEQRERLARDANMARRAAFESGMGGAWNQLRQGNFEGLRIGIGGAINMAGGATDEFEHVARTAALDLAEFDRLHGEELGIAKEDRYSAGFLSSGAEEITKLLERQIAATERLTLTQGPPWQGPSMEAGLT